MSLYIKIRPYLSALIGVGCAFLVLGVFYTIVAIRDSQTENSPILKEVRALAEQIDSCTNPDGACAQQGQEQTANAVAQIALEQAYALVCSVTEDENTTEQTPVELLRKIQACTADLKEQANATPQ